MKNVRRNLTSFYQKGLMLVETDCLASLRIYCKELEQIRESIDGLAGPVRRNTALEPDLAYVAIAEERLKTVGVVSRAEADEEAHNLLPMSRIRAHGCKLSNKGTKILLWMQEGRVHG